MPVHGMSACFLLELAGKGFWHLPIDEGISGIIMIAFMPVPAVL